MGRRDIHKAKTRKAISDAAMRLFVTHGFDAVSMDDIAKAADVARTTVFNHFQHKEDLVFDREPDMLQVLDEALRQPDPIHVLGERLTMLASEGNPLLGAVQGAPGFWALLQSSPALQARVLKLMDRMETLIGERLAPRYGEMDARIIAATASGLWRLAWRSGISKIEAGEDILAVRTWQKDLIRTCFDMLGKSVIG
ncbi:MAG: TetR family transcriptional regulator [Porphyrobacter sp.]|nr:TetR family transcriptional regulator [Porphyrobacter sp.]